MLQNLFLKDKERVPREGEGGRREVERKLPFYLLHQEGQPAPSFVVVPIGIVHS